MESTDFVLRAETSSVTVLGTSFTLPKSPPSDSTTFFTMAFSMGISQVA